MMRRKKDPPESSRANRRAGRIERTRFSITPKFVPWTRQGVNILCREGGPLRVWAAKLTAAWSARLVVRRIVK